MLKPTARTRAASASREPSANRLISAAPRLLAAALCTAAAGAALAGCGDEASAPGPKGSGPVRGGTLHMLSPTDVDFLDPGRTYYTAGYQVALATQRPLYRYRPGDAQHPVPDLAEGAPQISDGGRTVTVRLRAGVRFSPPVRRPVTSADVAYAFERAFTTNVGNAYTSYFQDLEGVPRAPTGVVRPISGIRTPDDRTIVFRLRRPAAASFAAALIMPVTAPVPREYAARFDAQSPSTYNTHVVATGPYMVRNDAQGRTVGYRPGQRIELVRNPQWRAATDARPALLDRIVIATNRSDSTLAARQVYAGRAAVLGGSTPPGVLRRLAADGGAQRSASVRISGFRYLPINTSIAPFDNADVRRAIQAAFDRTGARLLRGGEATGDIATHYLPPGLPGFAEAGGEAGPGLDFLDRSRAGGDLTLARRYLRRAGYASGRYDGGGTFLMVGPNAEPERGVAELAKDQLERLGFHIRLRLMAYDTALVGWCQVPARKVAICGGLTWGSDFADPASLMELAFGSLAITPRGNGNMAQLRDPRIDRAMRAAETLRGPARARAWGRVDRMVTAQAPGVLLQWDRATLLRSPDVAGVPNDWFVGWDLSYTGLRRR